MADYTIGVYDFDPYFTFSRSVGGEIVYAGPTSTETDATITDNGTGVAGLGITDSDETATGSITINGNTSTNVTISAEESWTLLNMDTGEVFQMITFEVESGPAAGYYTISEQPLVSGETYRTIAFDTNPNEGESTFSYGDYVDGPADGTVDGTDADDIIDETYTGDQQGEEVDNLDSQDVTPVQLDLNWDAEGADETDLFGGVSQDTGGILVDVSFTDDGAGTEWSVESSQIQYVAPGETFDTQSALLLYGNGPSGDTSTTRVDFSSVTGSGFEDEVRDVQFRINDIDSADSGFRDVVTVRAFDADGNEVDVQFLIGGDETLSGNTITGGDNPNSESDLDGSVLITIPGPVAYFTIDYDQGGTGTQAVYITDIEFNAIPFAGNEDVIDAGAGDDSIDSGLASDTVFGGTGDDTINASEDDDTLYGGADSDTFQMGDGLGNDEIFGGGGGVDFDTIDASDLTSGVTVTFTDGEDGTVDGVDTDATFENIENLILTDQADTLDGALSDESIEVNAGEGDDVITGGSGDDTLEGGQDQDTFNMLDGFGSDTIEGGELGTDNDTIDGSTLSSGVTVTFTDGEEGTFTDGTDTATFSEIESFVLTGQADTVDGTSSTDAMTIFAGAGEDTITGGTASDELDGGSGADTLDGGDGDDTLYGGTGDDVLIGGEGADDIFGGSGQDTVDYSTSTSGVTVNLTTNTGTGGDADGDTFAGVDGIIGSAFDDTLTGYDAQGADFTNIIDGGAGDDVISGLGGDDTLDGGSGADTIFGGTGSDTITGGSGADSIDGGDGEDSMSGGTGDDVLILGVGDLASGGDGDDTFVIDGTQTGTGTITITGGEGDETAGDTLDFNGQLDLGSLVITDDDDENGGLTGFAFLLDGTRVEFSEIENIICFARGTQIMTHSGEVLIEDLIEGDQIMTLDNGLQQIRWIGSRIVPAQGDFAPITIAKGTLGNHTDLTVSPQHRMLVSGPQAELLFGEHEVLVPAKHLLSWDGVYRAQMDTVEYFHVLFDAHQIIHANGCLSESFHPGQQAIDAVSEAARDEILSLFPELADAPETYGPSARFSLRAFEAELLGQNMM